MFDIYCNKKRNVWKKFNLDTYYLPSLYHHDVRCQKCHIKICTQNHSVGILPSCEEKIIIGRKWVEIWKSRSQLRGQEIWQTGKINLCVKNSFNIMGMKRKYWNGWGSTEYHTPWSAVLLEKLTGSQLAKKFLPFYGTWRFITVFTVPAICTCPEPAWSSPYPHIPLPENSS